MPEGTSPFPCWHGVLFSDTLPNGNALVTCAICGNCLGELVHTARLHGGRAYRWRQPGEGSQATLEIEQEAT